MKRGDEITPMGNQCKAQSCAGNALAVVGEPSGMVRDAGKQASAWHDEHVDCGKPGRLNRFCRFRPFRVRRTKEVSNDSTAHSNAYPMPRAAPDRKITLQDANKRSARPGARCVACSISSGMRSRASGICQPTIVPM